MDILLYRVVEKEKLYAVLQDDDKLKHYVFEKDFLSNPRGPWQLNKTKEITDIVSLLAKIGHESIIDPKTDGAAQLVSFFKQIKKDIKSNSDNVSVYKKCSEDVKQGLSSILSIQKDEKFNCNKFFGKHVEVFKDKQSTK